MPPACRDSPPPAVGSPEEVPDGACCPICHNVILLQDEAFLERCYHRFCYHCLVQWTEAQGAHPPPAGPWYTCPICKRPYAFILHDVRHDTFRKHHVPGADDLSDDGAGSFSLAAEHSRRRGVYFGPPSRFTEDAASATGNARSRLGPSALRSQAELWLRRELQALLLQEDVQLVLLHMLGHVDSRRGAAEGRRSKDTTWLSDVAGAARQFVFEHAGRLAEELAAFCDSGLTVPAYDAAVARAQRQVQEEMLERQRRERRAESPSPPPSVASEDDQSTGSPGAGAAAASSAQPEAPQDPLAADQDIRNTAKRKKPASPLS